MQPQKGHLDGMVRVFGYLNKFKKGKIMIDTNYPDHSGFKVTNSENWKEFYPDVEEMMQTGKSVPRTKGPPIQITVYVDADHAHDMVTQRSVTGVLLFLNNTPVK